MYYYGQSYKLHITLLNTPLHSICVVSYVNIHFLFYSIH